MTACKYYGRMIDFGHKNLITSCSLYYHSNNVHVLIMYVYSNILLEAYVSACCLLKHPLVYTYIVPVCTY